MYNPDYSIEDKSQHSSDELEDEEDEYSEYIKEDYSLFCTEYEPNNFNNLQNRMPGVGTLKRAHSSVETTNRTSTFQSTPSVPESALISETRLCKSKSVQYEDCKKDEGIDGFEDAEEQDKEPSFLYRLNESKKGYVKDTCVKRVYRREEKVVKTNKEYEQPSFSSDNLLNSHVKPQKVKKEVMV